MPQPITKVITKFQVFTPKYTLAGNPYNPEEPTYFPMEDDEGKVITFDTLTEAVAAIRENIDIPEMFAHETVEENASKRAKMWATIFTQRPGEPVWDAAHRFNLVMRDMGCDYYHIISIPADE